MYLSLAVSLHVPAPPRNAIARYRGLQAHVKTMNFVFIPIKDDLKIIGQPVSNWFIVAGTRF